MSQLKIASVQFENWSGSKDKNLAIIRRMASDAANRGCNVVAFHECSVTGYTFASRLSKEELLHLAEEVPAGPSSGSLIEIARELGIAILAGLFEKDENGRIYNTYICVDSTRGFVAKFRKLHPFISPHLSPGNEYVVFDLLGWKCGILICYDNNVVENVRATALLGAEIIFMPHVTMCTPSTRPGAGFVDPSLWTNRDQDPTSLRAEFNGLKGRQWLMKWLPARAYDNAVYVVFSNPIGMDDDQLKNGCSMILDPFGDILSECSLFGEDMAVATCSKEKLQLAGGFRYKQARRPELYQSIIGSDHNSSLNVSWLGK
ncbi:omega-amidase NIT2 [Fusarium subglutinans]|uniref:Omega-amidase NIT2 n=1 Tax=Gibberella subglutinans TaxID=42677 RepID=A0A8H5Q8K0_GIBSU|nr:omega-amidase NIT2 [Fusarium subglutinans]KAF5610093.1 omega-amidase NIT2 [Fusarium subglutinans]